MEKIIRKFGVILALLTTMFCGPVYASSDQISSSSTNTTSRAKEMIKLFKNRKTDCDNAVEDYLFLQFKTLSLEEQIEVTNAIPSIVGRAAVIFANMLCTYNLSVLMEHSDVFNKIPEDVQKHHIGSKVQAKNVLFQVIPHINLKGHTDYVKSAQFNHDGTKIVTASHDKTAKVWSYDQKCNA